MKYETIDALQIDDLMERRDVRPPRDAHDSKQEKKEAQPKVEEKPESKAEEPQNDNGNDSSSNSELDDKS